MIRQLAQWYAEKLRLAGVVPAGDVQRQATEAVWRLHPQQLLRFLEESWAYGGGGTSTRPDLPLPPILFYGLVPGLESGVRDDLPGIANTIFDPPVIVRPPGAPLDSGRGGTWEHLIYAYLVENTRVADILRRVVREYREGERLETPSATGHWWLRTTEDLFLRPLPSGSIAAITSDVRPDAGAVRRNAYYRMFGMDLNHGCDDGTPYAYPRSSTANTDFVSLFEDFLREIWVASENFRNSSGTNPTDEAAIAAYARDLADMLTTRRQNGNLAREEFAIVTAMSWFHLVLESDNAIVADLKASAGSQEERLRKIGERVAIAPHARSENFLKLAPLTAALLREVELGSYNNPANVSALYANVAGVPNPLRRDVLDIINQWTVATGHDLKKRRPPVTVSGAGIARRQGGGARVGV